MAAREFVSVRRIGDVRAALISSGELHYRPPFADGLDWVTDDTVIDTESGWHGVPANMVAAGYSDAGTRRAATSSTPGRAKSRLSRATRFLAPGMRADLDGITVSLISDASECHTGDSIILDRGMSVVV